MKITVGKSPDFKMTRDRELVSHVAAVEMVASGRIVNRRVLSNFSLVMLCKSVQEISTVEQSMGKFELRISDHTIHLTFSASEFNVAIMFKFPNTLSAMELGVVGRFIRRFFYFSN